MPCTICKTNGCRADVCVSPIIEESYRTLLHTFEREVGSTASFAEWPAYRVSTTTNYWLYPDLFEGEPDAIREKISGARARYLTHHVAVESGKTINRVMFSWGIGLFKRVLPRLLSNFPAAYTEYLVEYNRILESNSVTPRTRTDYKAYISELMGYCIVKSVPPGFLNLRDVPNEHLIPPTPAPVRRQPNPRPRPRTVYRDRILYREVRIVSTITLNMCASDEKYMIDDTCPICMEDAKPNNVVAFTCGHAFCCDCSVEFLKRGHCKCPMCRTNTTDVKFKAGILPEKFNALMAVVK